MSITFTEIIAFVKEKGKASLSDIAARLGVPEESALFFIGKLAGERKKMICDMQAGRIWS